MDASLLHFRHPVEADARQLLLWRRSSEITRHMYTEVPDDLDRQRAWLASMDVREDFRHFVIGSGGEDIGYLSYSRIDRVHLHCVPGFYVCDGRGIPRESSAKDGRDGALVTGRDGVRGDEREESGTAWRTRRAVAAGYLHWFIMDYAFYRLGMNKVISEVLDTNIQIIRSLRLLKEREVGVMRQHIRKADVWHDVYLFELLRSEWEASRRPLPTTLTLAAFPLE